MRDSGTTRADVPRAVTIHGLIEERATRDPGRTAVVAGDESVTYGDLVSRAHRLARVLSTRGVVPGALVAVGTGRGIDTVVALLAVLAAGCSYVPLDLDQPEVRVAFMLRDSAASVLLVQTGSHRNPTGHRAEIVFVDAPDAPGNPVDAPLPPPVPDGLAYVMYTSGSTGEPKGVAVTHRGVVNLVTDQDYVTIDRDDRVAALSTLAFDASTFEIWAPLVNGATCVLYTFTGDDVARLLRRIRHDDISILHVTSPVFRLFDPDDLRDLPHLHTVLFGGDRVLARTGERLAAAFDGRMVHLYGPTETTAFATFHDLGPAVHDEIHLPIGRPLSGVDVEVVDGDGTAVAGAGEGELWIGGVGVANGYLGRPALTAQKFPARSGGAVWYRTGDMVRRDESGCLHFLGRLDRQVKVRGHRVEPGEIEMVLLRHPLVREAVVLAREDGEGDVRLDAYVVPETGWSAHPDVAGEVGRHAATVLPRHLQPAAFTTVRAIPLTANLKVDEARLPVPGLVKTDSSPGLGPDELMSSLWRTAIGTPKIGPDDNFFEIGGDSLSALRVTATFEARTGVPMGVRDILRNPTLRALSAVIASRGDA